MAETGSKKNRAGKQTEYITVGEVLGAWGLKGAFRVRPTTDFPERFEPGETVFIDGVPNTIQSSNWQKDGVIMTIAGVDTPEAAAKLRRKTLDIPASELHDLPEGQYYQFDIIGLEVRTLDGTILGKVTDILNCGNDVYVVKGEGKKDVLIPATKDVVKSIDVKKGKMIIEPIEGLLG
ncbi:MAG: 16S rRNA processing protein RimM [Dehalococcoidia bacterium]|nr:MAG: 16S rRNA processing protein RimM [Dehalococcoidia bacterium]